MMTIFYGLRAGCFIGAECADGYVVHIYILGRAGDAVSVRKRIGGARLPIFSYLCTDALRCAGC